MVPRDKRIAADWICKNQPRVENLQRPVYPPLGCQTGCLHIGDSCYEYKLSNSWLNDSLDCAGNKPYLSYFNENFANHGIELIFSVGCDVKKEYERNGQVRMVSQNERVHYLSTNVKVFQLHKSDTIVSSCGPTTQLCDDRSCRAQSIICMLDFDCAPNVCACTVDNQLSYNKEYCRHHCPPGICNCAPLMFQCSVGGCVPYLYVCDNEYNCADSSDEFCVFHTAIERHLRNTTANTRFLSAKSFHLCFDFICSAGQCIDINLVNDLIPDCSDFSDEYHGLSVKYDGSYFPCNDVREMPCIPGHSKCFEIHKICLYDLDNVGHISYCRDGAHLLNCTFVECTNSFKCPGSYCIPLRNVCDGVHDCRDGEDEITCQNNICPGYLKCSGVDFCIHPIEVCDGLSHCPYGDDEEFCEIRNCPMGCACLWRSLVCRDARMAYIPEPPLQDIIYLSLGFNNEFDLTFANLSSLSRLIILDLSNSLISSVCPAFQEDFRFFESLHALYLQMNGIKYLSSFCSNKFPSLLVINLQGNHLINIANDAFKGISLHLLILKDTFLASLSGHWIDGFDCLNTLDKRGVKLDYWSETVVNGLETLKTIYTDDARLCCILHNINGCYDTTKNHVQCFRLLSQSVVGLLIIPLVFMNLIFIMITMRFVRSLFSVTRPAQCFIYEVILLSKSLYVSYVLAVAIIDMYMADHYIFWNSLPSSKLFCQALSITFSIGIVMYNIAVAFRDHITYMAMSRMLINEYDVYTTAKKFMFMSYLLVVTGFGLLPFLLDDKPTAHQWCTSPLGVRVYNHKWVVIRPALVGSIIFLSLIYSFFAYYAIYRRTYSSWNYIQTMTSPKRNTHQPPMLSKLTKNLCQSTIFRSLECLPILSSTFATMCGIYVSLDIQLMSIFISSTFGSITSEIKPVWYPMFIKHKI